MFLLQPPTLLTPAQIKLKSFESRQKCFSFLLSSSSVCLIWDGRASHLRACLDAVLLSQHPNRSDGGQMRGDKEFPSVAHVSNSSRVWRKEGAGKRCSVSGLAAQVGGDIVRHWWKRCPSSDKTFNPNCHGFVHIASPALLQSRTTSEENGENRKTEKNRLHLLLFSLTRYIFVYIMLSSRAVWRSRWPSWACRPNEPYGFCGRKATLNRAVLRHWSVFIPNISEDMKLYITITSCSHSNWFLYIYLYDCKYMCNCNFK